MSTAKKLMAVYGIVSIIFLFCIAILETQNFMEKQERIELSKIEIEKQEKLFYGFCGAIEK